MSWQRPSLGFSLVVATYALSVAFFAWGLSTPPLDRVWQLHHELKIGRVYKLSKASLRLLLDVQTPPQYIPYEIEIDGPGWERELEVHARGPLAIELPPPPAVPELISFKIKGDELRADPSSIGVRMTFDPPPELDRGSEDEEDDE